jgi:hypothetical protein
MRRAHAARACAAAPPSLHAARAVALDRLPQSEFGAVAQLSKHSIILRNGAEPRASLTSPLADHLTAL